MITRSLDQGRIVLMMPEGRVTLHTEREDGIGALRDGAGVVLAKRPSRLLIISVTGTDAVLPCGTVFPRLRFGRSRSHIRMHVDDISVDTVASWSHSEIMDRIRDHFVAALQRLDAAD